MRSVSCLLAMIVGKEEPQRSIAGRLPIVARHDSLDEFVEIVTRPVEPPEEIVGPPNNFHAYGGYGFTHKPGIQFRR